MRCTSCNEPTRVLETRQRPDGTIRRRRECTNCGRRFTTGEIPEHSDWLGELPEVGPGPDGGGPLEGVRRRAIIAAVRDQLAREMGEAVAELKSIADEQRAVLDRAEARERAQETTT
jgi:Transcriptional repressor NrdR-like, N-terminal domain